MFFLYLYIKKMFKYKGKNHYLIPYSQDWFLRFYILVSFYGIWSYIRIDVYNNKLMVHVYLYCLLKIPSGHLNKWIYLSPFPFAKVT